MAVDGYVLIGHDGRPRSGAAHTHVGCPTIKYREDWVIARIEDTTGRWRHYKFSVKWCDQCPPVPDWSWHSKAACRDTYPPVDMLTPGNWARTEALIKDYCDRCPVVKECGATALDDIHNSFGIWGGVFLPSNSGPHAARARELADKVAILRGLA